MARPRKTPAPKKRGGYRPGSGRKSIGDAALNGQICIRLNREQHVFLRSVAAASDNATQKVSEVIRSIIAGEMARRQHG